jgi:hypothetical protein
VNQVSGSGMDMHPALGLSWAASVNARFILSRYGNEEEYEAHDDLQSNNNNQGGSSVRTLPPQRRTLRVSFSPCHRDNDFLFYEIRNNGLISYSV